MIKEYTLSIFSESQLGILNRIVSVFTRRHIDIKSMNSSKSSIEGLYRYTIVVHVTEVEVQKLVAQLERQVEVLKAFAHLANDIVYQEIALYKVPTKSFMHGDTVETLVRSYNARILSIEPEYIVLEKTGHQEETQQFLDALQQYGVYEFVRSGRVAISKPMERLNAYLKEREEELVNN